MYFNYLFSITPYETYPRKKIYHLPPYHHDLLYCNYSDNEPNHDSEEDESYDAKDDASNGQTSGTPGIVFVFSQTTRNSTHHDSWFNFDRFFSVFQVSLGIAKAIHYIPSGEVACVRLSICSSPKKMFFYFY